MYEGRIESAREFFRVLTVLPVVAVNYFVDAFDCRENELDADWSCAGAITSETLNIKRL